MVKRRQDFPSEGEFIVGTVKEINPNSVFVHLDEYDKQGMIHISEIAKKWVRDIRDWVSVDKKIICQVKDVRKDKGQVDLSLKDVSDRDKNRRMQTWKRDERGEEFLEDLAEEENSSLDEIYERIGFDLQENFKDMLEPFEIAVKKGEEELVKRGMDEEWTHKIKDIGEENIKAKSEELKERFTLRTWESNGVEVIKKCLGNVADENSVKFNYISAPEYEITKESRDLSEGEEILKKSIKDLKEELKNKDAEVQALFE